MPVTQVYITGGYFHGASGEGRLGRLKPPSILVSVSSIVKAPCFRDVA